FAIDDSFVDGSDTQAFPDQPELLSRIRGPLTIEGGFGGKPDPVIGEPLMLPFENNDRVPDGTVTAATSTSLTDASAPWLTTQSYAVNTSDDLTLHVDRGISIGDTVLSVKLNGIDVALAGLTIGIDAHNDDVTIHGRISYNDLEVLNIQLGSGNDLLTVESTHTGLTTIDTGRGNDTVDVRTISGHTQISTGSELDVVNIGSGVATVPGTNGAPHL